MVAAHVPLFQIRLVLRRVQKWSPASCCNVSMSPFRTERARVIRRFGSSRGVRGFGGSGVRGLGGSGPDEAVATGSVERTRETKRKTIRMCAGWHQMHNTAKDSEMTMRNARRKTRSA